jgi:cytoskeletal protein CcmA (bactofilin family)
MSNAKKTLVEEGTEFKGSLASNCPVEVKGRIEGEVKAPILNVSATGSVRGKVKVNELRSEGELAGEFDADTVQLSGNIRDNTVIRAKSLEVKLATGNGKMQVMFGECELDIGKEPAKEETTHRGKHAKGEAKGDGNGSIPPGPAEKSG